MAPTWETDATRRSRTARDSAAVAKSMMATMCDVCSFVVLF